MYEVVHIDSKIIEVNKRKYEGVYGKNGNIVVSAFWPGKFPAKQVNALENKEDDFLARLSQYNPSAKAAVDGLDNVPSVSFGFGSVAYLMALAYDAQMIKLNGSITAEPLYHTTEQAVKFQKKADIFDCGLYPVICERIAEFQERWPQIPIGICDNQSPINVLTSIFHSESAMIAMFEDKEIIHALLSGLTDSIIELNRHLESIINNFKGFTAQHFNYLPNAMQISDDNAAFLSPTLYAEFAQPYTEKLVLEFDGLNFHCCMGYEQNLKNIANTKGFCGFDPQVDYNSIENILDAVEGKGVWVVNNFREQKRNERTETDEETFMRAIDMSEGRCGLVVNVFGENREQAVRMGHFVKDYASRKGRI